MKNVFRANPRWSGYSASRAFFMWDGFASRRPDDCGNYSRGECSMSNLIRSHLCSSVFICGSNSDRLEQLGGDALEALLVAGHLQGAGEGVSEVALERVASQIAAAADGPERPLDNRHSLRRASKTRGLKRQEIPFGARVRHPRGVQQQPARRLKIDIYPGQRLPLLL